MKTGEHMTAENFPRTAPLNSENALTCPLCGAPTEVRNSRPFAEHGFTTTRRRRYCTRCPHRFNTIEITTATYDRLTGIPARLAAVRGALDALFDHIDRVRD